MTLIISITLVVAMLFMAGIALLRKGKTVGIVPVVISVPCLTEEAVLCMASWHAALALAEAEAEATEWNFWYTLGVTEWALGFEYSYEYPFRPMSGSLTMYLNGQDKGRASTKLAARLRALEEYFGVNWVEDLAAKARACAQVKGEQDCPRSVEYYLEQYIDWAEAEMLFWARLTALHNMVKLCRPSVMAVADTIRPNEYTAIATVYYPQPAFVGEADAGEDAHNWEAMRPRIDRRGARSGWARGKAKNSKPRGKKHR